MARRIDRDVRPLVKAAQQQGWTLDFTSRGHLKIIPPDGGVPVYGAGTTSDRRSIKNLAAMLRRAGVQGI
jgi:hypothetical protein